MKTKTELNIEQISKQYEKNKPPQYCTRTPDFYCPLSPQVPWYMGLVYKDCPVNEENRDMGHCADCKLRGENTFKLIKKAERKSRKPHNRKK